MALYDNPDLLTEDEIGAGEYFGIWVYGAFNITNKGSYSFMIGANDKIEVFIDNNPGIETSGSKIFTVTLSAGYHKLFITHHESEGSVTVSIRYKGEDTKDEYALLYS